MSIKIALVVGIIVFIVCYHKFFLNGNKKEKRFIEEAQKNGHYTEAVAVDVKSHLGDSSSGNDAYRFNTTSIKYKYTVSGKDYFMGLDFLEKSSIPSQHPSRIRVYYNPKNPKKALCRESVGDVPKASGYYKCIFAAIITIIIVNQLLKLLIQ